MRRDLECNQLKQSYQDQLVQAGLTTVKAEQLAQIQTLEELRLVQEVGAEGAAIFFQLERAIIELRSN